MNSTVCIIPARGGSKRIPRKNVLPLAGVPLLAYSLRSAREADVFDRIVVSTEDAEIAELAKSEGIEVDHRPEHLCGDRVRMVEVVEEFLQRPENSGTYQNVAALLPTCPFRTAHDIRSAVQLFNEHPDEPFLLGVVEYDFPPQLAMEPGSGDDPHVTMVDPGAYGMTTRSQDIRTLLHPNGSIYIGDVAKFLERSTFFQEKMLAYVMPPERSFDIDYPYQFQIAEGMMAQLLNQEQSK